MNGGIRRHGVQKCDVIDATCDVGKQVADPFPTFTVLLELPFGLDNPSLISLSASTERLDVHRLPIHSVHVWLVIERVDVTRPTVHEKKDHTLRLRSKVLRLRRKRI